MMAQDEAGGRGGGQELATSTLAEIYAQQGLLERARAIYERIAQRTPDDPRVAERLEALSQAIRERSGAKPAGDGPVGGDRVHPGTEVVQNHRTLVEETAPDEVFEAWLRRR